LIVIGKFLIWFGVVRLFRYTTRTALLVGVGLTQIGEFSYVLVLVARGAELVTNSVYNAMLMASLL
jgi:CPA2 family monovalent cation:H+ antiporter-2